MKKQTVLLTLLVLLLATLLGTGFVAARYISSHHVTTQLVITIEASEFSLTLDANRGAFDDSAVTKDVTVAYKGTYGDLPVPVRRGYSFTGWYTEKSGGTRINGEDRVEITRDTTVYAHWSADSYRISFDTQVDSLENPPDQTAVFDRLYGTLPELARPGYTFSGWTLTPNGNDYVTSGTYVTTPYDHTLYAQWDARVYTVRYHANGGEGTMEDQVVKYDHMFTLNTNTFTKAHHTFMGWALASDLTAVAYIDRQEVVNLLEQGTLDLYAVWAENTYTLFFDYNLGEGSTPYKQVVYGQQYGVLPTYPTRYECLFTGWYTERDGGVRVYPETIVELGEKGQMGINKQVIFTQTRECSSSVRIRLE